MPMDLRNAVITDITDVFTVYSVKDRFERMHNRKCYGLSLCRAGQITYIQNGKEYLSEVDTVAILPKGCTYWIRGDKTGYFPLINFECREFLCDTVTVLPVENAEELIADYERIQKLFFCEGNHAQIFSIFYGMLHKLSSDTIPFQLERAVQLIKNEYGNPLLTNAVLAAECNMSEVYFRKLFTEHFKISPKQYVIDVRIQEAKRMLAQGVYSVAAVSEQCGFSGPYHFCRVFKQRTGTTPTEYRKENLIYKI